ncbi:transposase, partial [Heliobacterium undosum]|nr:transposase [Heliomicrobium undosum]
GRPKKDALPDIEMTFHAQCVVGELRPEAWEQACRKESTFILIYDVRDSMSPAEILTEYKRQNTIEMKFRFLKSPVMLGPVYLKSKRRIEALGYVFVLALMLASYLEFRVRREMKQREEFLLLPGKKKTQVPSITTILEYLNMITVVSINGQRLLPDNVDKEALKMIRWAGFTEALYTEGL